MTGTENPTVGEIQAAASLLLTVTRAPDLSLPSDVLGLLEKAEAEGLMVDGTDGFWEAFSVALTILAGQTPDDDLPQRT